MYQVYQKTILNHRIRFHEPISSIHINPPIRVGPTKNQWESRKINDTVRKNRNLLLRPPLYQFSIFIFRGCTIMKVWPLIIFVIHLTIYNISI